MTLEAAWSWLGWAVVRLIEENPYLVLMALYAVARATAVTVETGYHGVRFSFGRAGRDIGPGLHWLVPFLQVVRILPSRARTIDLPAQRVTTRDGLVADVDAAVVYRVARVRAALVEIDRLEKGMTQLLGLAVQDVLRELGREALRRTPELDRRLAAAMQVWVEPWGVAIVRAGFARVVPAAPSLRVLQTGARGAARRERFGATAPEVGDAVALALLGGAGTVERRAARARDHEVARARDRGVRRAAAAAFRILAREARAALRPFVVTRAPVDASRSTRLALDRAAQTLAAGRAPDEEERSGRWRHRHRNVAGRPDPARARREREGTPPSAATAIRSDAREARRQRAGVSGTRKSAAASAKAVGHRDVTSPSSPRLGRRPIFGASSSSNPRSPPMRLVILAFLVASLSAVAQEAAPSPPAPDYAAHVAALRERLPGPEFSIAVEAPFVVAGNLPQAEVDRWARGTIRWAVGKLKAKYFAKDPARILDIWLLRDRATYEETCTALTGRAPTTPYGFYSPWQKLLIMNIGTGGGTLVHEIVHPFVEANFPGCPAWFNEGLGSLYEQSAERDGAIVGLTNWRLAGLQDAIRAGTAPTIETVARTSTGEFYGERRGVNYATARYLMYYLQERDLLVRYYREFTAASEADPTGYATLVKVLGEPDMKAFQKRWEEYCLALRFER